MFLEQLSVMNFRNYDSFNIKLNKNINIFYGKNAQGKTNILESIYYLSFTKSYRTKNDEDLLKNNKKVFKVEGVLNKNNIKDKYLIKYNLENKYLYINKTCYKKISDYISNINVITFTPDDIEILKGLPEVRRFRQYNFLKKDPAAAMSAAGFIKNRIGKNHGIILETQLM